MSSIFARMMPIYSGRINVTDQPNVRNAEPIPERLIRFLFHCTGYSVDIEKHHQPTVQYQNWTPSRGPL